MFFIDFAFKLSFFFTQLAFFIADFTALHFNQYLGCLFDIRSALSGLAGKGLDETAAGIYRTRLLNIYESRKDDPEFWLKMTADRITDGKNLEARYRETIPAVTAADVNRMLAALYGGSKVEYIIKQD